MDAVQGGDARLPEVRRHRFVGGQHELLDQAVRDVALQRHDAGHLAGGRQDDLRLGEIEVDAAAPAAALVQDAAQLLHQAEHRHEIAVARRHLGVALHQDLRHVGVGHARRAPDDALREAVRQDVPLAVEGHQRLHRIFRLRDLHEQQQAFRDQPSCIVVLSRPRNGPFFSTRSELLQHASGDHK